MSIGDNVRRLLKELPEEVQLLVAAKGRTPAQVMEAVAAGAGIIGENYVQEAEEAFAAVGRKARWHFIGHLQRNKVKKAVSLFDMVETLDSVALAAEIEKKCLPLGKEMPVLIEVNSGRERQKTGVLPEDAAGIIEQISGLPHVKVMGLMTMGPLSGDPEDARPYFRETRQLFTALRQRGLPGTEMRYLSMGMSASYRIALEEGANIVRIGTRIFDCAGQ
ncbi:MAG: YggS family pyridoxal phosphate-dependent enzyme [Chloroflexota bacterium]